MIGPFLLLQFMLFLGPPASKHRQFYDSSYRIDDFAKLCLQFGFTFYCKFVAWYILSLAAGSQATACTITRSLGSGPLESLTNSYVCFSDKKKLL